MPCAMFGSVAKLHDTPNSKLLQTFLARVQRIRYASNTKRLAIDAQEDSQAPSTLNLIFSWRQHIVHAKRIARIYICGGNSSRLV